MADWRRFYSKPYREPMSLQTKRSDTGKSGSLTELGSAVETPVSGCAVERQTMTVHYRFEFCGHAEFQVPDLKFYLAEKPQRSRRQSGGGQLRMAVLAMFGKRISLPGTALATQRGTNSGTP
jgi:hypothetical protein